MGRARYRIFMSRREKHWFQEVRAGIQHLYKLIKILLDLDQLCFGQRKKILVEDF